MSKGLAPALGLALMLLHPGIASADVPAVDPVGAAGGILFLALGLFAGFIAAMVIFGIVWGSRRRRL